MLNPYWIAMKVCFKLFPNHGCFKTWGPHIQAHGGPAGLPTNASGDEASIEMSKTRQVISGGAEVDWISMFSYGYIGTVIISIYIYMYIYICIYIYVCIYICIYIYVYIYIWVCVCVILTYAMYCYFPILCIRLVLKIGIHDNLN